MAQAAIRLIKSDNENQPPFTPTGGGDDGNERHQSLLPSVSYDDERFNRLVLMAEITADLVETLFSAPDERAGSHKYLIPDRERDHASFAVWHLALMIREQKNVFDKALEAE